MFRRIEENGEWGTPEQWNVKLNSEVILFHIMFSY